jgi:uncharacterized protein (TIGR02145 family)
MNRVKITLAVAISIASAFTFSSCANNDDGDSGGCNDPSATVNINGQIWLKCNLNVSHSSGNSWCYEGTDASTETTLSGTQGCDKYGRLYDWAAAMNLPDKCNNTLSTEDSDCAITLPRHRGLCPQNFHIPTDIEWDELMTAVGGSSTAGRYLKATSGWYGDGNGLDTYGFSALPGGTRFSSGSYFGDAGSYGSWWNATEIDASYAYHRHMFYGYENVNRYDNYDKSNGFSIRCVQD